MKDYYRTLQVDPQADIEVINGAYRALVKQFHPDLYHTSRKVPMTEKMREINEAYEVLSNAKRRATYDQTYQRRRPSEQAQTSAGASRKQQLVRGLTWFLATYVFAMFVLRPLGSSIGLRVMLLVLLGLWLWRRSQKK